MSQSFSVQPLIDAVISQINSPGYIVTPLPVLLAEHYIMIASIIERPQLLEAVVVAMRRDLEGMLLFFENESGKGVCDVLKAVLFSDDVLSSLIYATGVFSTPFPLQEYSSDARHHAAELLLCIVCYATKLWGECYLSMWYMSAFGDLVDVAKSVYKSMEGEVPCLTGKKEMSTVPRNHSLEFRVQNTLALVKLVEQAKQAGSDPNHSQLKLNMAFPNPNDHVSVVNFVMQSFCVPTIQQVGRPTPASALAPTEGNVGAERENESVTMIQNKDKYRDKHRERSDTQSAKSRRKVGAENREPKNAIGTSSAPNNSSASGYRVIAPSPVRHRSWNTNSKCLQR